MKLKYRASLVCHHAKLRYELSSQTRRTIKQHLAEKTPSYATLQVRNDFKNFHSFPSKMTSKREQNNQANTWIALGQKKRQDQGLSRSRLATSTVSGLTLVNHGTKVMSSKSNMHDFQPNSNIKRHRLSNCRIMSRQPRQNVRYCIPLLAFVNDDQIIFVQCAVRIAYIYKRDTTHSFSPYYRMRPHPFLTCECQHNFTCSMGSVSSYF